MPFGSECLNIHHRQMFYEPRPLWHFTFMEKLKISVEAGNEEREGEVGIICNTGARVFLNTQLCSTLDYQTTGL